MAGDFFVFKVAGAAAERGDDLDAVTRIAARANALTRTFGAAFAGCTLRARPSRCSPSTPAPPNSAWASTANRACAPPAT
ncbi:dihydroxyacetone kinase subunit DhaK [Streptomyces albulus]|nr:dihydroxyacetone kinase subunit DhaK [Streptomyces noursei]